MIEELTKIWEVVSPASDFLYSVAITACSALLLWLFRARVNLVWGSTSKNFHQYPGVDEGVTISIWTEKFFVQNSGRKPARDIEIVFSVPPTSYNLWPPREHSRTTLENGNFVLKVPSISPRELLIVDIVDVRNSGVRLLSVNCPDAMSKSVQFAATRQFGKLFDAFIRYLLVAGFLGTVYLLLKIFF